MRAWLAGRSDDPEEVEAVIAFLIENLALDDVRFSEAFARDKRDLAGWGADRIEATLRARGIDLQLAREAARGGSEPEADRAIRFLAERGIEVDTDRGRNRAMGMLARRGYAAEDAYAAIRRLGREGDPDQGVRFDDREPGIPQIDLQAPGPGPGS